MGPHKLWAVFVLYVAVGAQVTACDENHSKSQQTDTAPTRPSASRPAPAISAATSSSAATAPTSPKPPKPSVACKALGKKGQIPLGTMRDEAISGTLHAWGDWVYVLSQQPANARVTLRAFKRDGSRQRVVGSMKGIGRVGAVALTAEAAYFSFKKALWSVPLTGGEVRRVVEKFGRPLKIYANDIYTIRCGPHKQDALVKLPVGGSTVTTVATFARPKRKCDYRAIALDSQRAYVSDWSGRRIISIALDGSGVRVLATKQPFPTEVYVRGNDIDFTSSTGIHRVSTSGDGKPSLLSKQGSAPFACVASDDLDYWFFQGRPYEITESIWRVHKADGKTSKVWTYRANKDRIEEGTGIYDLAAMPLS